MSTTSAQEAPYADFGRHLTKLRKMAGITRSDFAKECGVALSSMQNYENGMRSPQAYVIVAMARVLHISTDELLDNKEIEADTLEEQGFEGEALTKRQQARIVRNMRETKNILYSGGLSLADTMAYALALQRVYIEAMENNFKR